MIVVEEGDSIVLITQPDHARFAAELLALWQTEGFPEHPRRKELLFAIREHDNGWREADAAPRVDQASGRPHDFMSFPLASRLEVWVRGSARYRVDHPYSTLVITKHALELHTDLRHESGWEELMESLEEHQAELLDQCGLQESELEVDYRFLAVGDALSLTACNRWTSLTERRGFQWRFEEDVLYLAPFPLAGSTSFRIPARRIPNRPYSGDADLGSELAAAPWGHRDVRVAPDSP